jgi:hypothetical protein
MGREKMILREGPVAVNTIPVIGFLPLELSTSAADYLQVSLRRGLG